MGPIAATFAREMRARDHDVSVVTAHPHYPPLWGSSWLPYREVRDGVPILRLPIRAGHDTTLKRVTEEVTFAAAAAVALAVLPSPDVYVVVSPSFLSLAPLSMSATLRRRPWVLWLQDILPDAAVTTGLLEHRLAIAPARVLERLAYASAARIVVISGSFRRTLLAKGVEERKLVTIYNPATRGFAAAADRRPCTPPRVLHLGNIGHSQGLEPVVRFFEQSALAARLVIVGTGERADLVRREVRTERVKLMGLVGDGELEVELSKASIGLVTQRPDVAEFNLPSRVMTLMARGIPIVAVVRPHSEIANIIRTARCGWVVDCEQPAAVVDALREAIEDAPERLRRAEAALDFARRSFDPSRMVETFEQILHTAVRSH